MYSEKYFVWFSSEFFDHLYLWKHGNMPLTQFYRFKHLDTLNLDFLITEEQYNDLKNALNRTNVMARGPAGERWRSK